MKCAHCKKPIAAGVEAIKLIVAYADEHGNETFYGYGMPAGPITNANGRPLHGYHHKCFHILRKREARGDPVSGRVLAGAPSGYDMAELVLTREEAAALNLSVQDVAERTTYLTDRLQALRELARSIGKGVGDPTVLEAFWAHENHGPYSHAHRIRQEMYQLRAHLSYAHGLDLSSNPGGLHELHDAVHHNAEITANRLADHDEAPAERDWHDQHQADI